MTEHHENEEKKLKSIISNHVHPSNDNYKVNVNIYRVSQKNVITLRMTRKPLFMNIEQNEIASNT